VTAVPGTSLFFTGSKDGDVKLWDVSKATMLGQWHKVHDRHTFLQHNARGFGAFVQVHYVVHVCAYVCVCVCVCVSLSLSLSEAVNSFPTYYNGGIYLLRDQGYILTNSCFCHFLPKPFL
jgi:hypothetical protein